MSKCKLLFEFLCLILLFSFVLSSFCACSDIPSALEIANEFSLAYGIDVPIYAKAKSEGDAGFADSEFFYSMYGDGEECVLDYAVLLISDLDTVGECAVFVCYTEYDAILVSDMCKRRMLLLRSLMGSADVSFLEDSFIKRKGKIVVMCVLSDNERASRIFDRII